MRVLLLLAFMASVGVAGCGGNDDAQAKADPNKGVVAGEIKPVPEPPPPEPKPDDFKGKGNAPPKGLVQGVRAAAYRPERQNDLKQIGFYFNEYVTNFNRNPASQDDFVKHIERDMPVVAKAIRDGLYVINPKAKSFSSNSVIAYETLQDQGGYQSVRGDCSVMPIPEDELRKLLMQ